MFVILKSEAENKIFFKADWKSYALFRVSYDIDGKASQKRQKHTNSLPS